MSINVAAKPAMNLQDSFLNLVRKESLGVIIYLVNGFQIRGLVRGFDNFTVIIENENGQQLVYNTPSLLSLRCPTSPSCSRRRGTEKGLTLKKNGASASFLP